MTGLRSGYRYSEGDDPLDIDDELDVPAFRFEARGGDRVTFELDQSIPCPLCRNSVSVPSCEVLVQHCAIPPMPARILRVIWNARGGTVPAERIFDVMYEDDPNGGPPGPKMYNAMKIGVWRLRHCLKGSGVDIEHVRGRGYRLRIRGH